MAATRRPWKAEKRDWRGEESEHDWYISGDVQEDEDGDGSYATAIAIVKGNATSGDIAECNAKLIVNAVNCHDDLLAACKRTVDAVEDYRSRIGFPTLAIAEAFEDCIAAIRKAKAAK